MKQVGKPDNTKGSEDALHRDWPDWSCGFHTWCCSQFEHAEVALEWAKARGPDPIGQEEVRATADDSVWDMARMNAQLHVALASLCRDEARAVV